MLSQGIMLRYIVIENTQHESYGEEVLKKTRDEKEKNVLTENERKDLSFNGFKRMISLAKPNANCFTIKLGKEI